jgi:hypothetical protein
MRTCSAHRRVTGSGHPLNGGLYHAPKFQILECD